MPLSFRSWASSHLIRRDLGVTDEVNSRDMYPNPLNISRSVHVSQQRFGADDDSLPSSCLLNWSSSPPASVELYRFVWSLLCPTGRSRSYSDICMRYHLERCSLLGSSGLREIIYAAIVHMTDNLDSCSCLLEYCRHCGRYVHKA